VTLEDELIKVAPKAERITIGSHRVYRFQVSTPACTFVSVAKTYASGSMIELTARDSFADDLAQQLLDHADTLELGDREADWIRVYPFEYSLPRRFNSIVVVPPLIAKRFDHQSEALSLVTFWVLPAFASEFRDGDSAKRFWHQLYRKDSFRVHVTNWNRLE
jgi:hypothetical protein